MVKYLNGIDIRCCEVCRGWRGFFWPSLYTLLMKVWRIYAARHSVWRHSCCTKEKKSKILS